MIANYDFVMMGVGLLGVSFLGSKIPESWFWKGLFDNDNLPRFGKILFVGIFFGSGALLILVGVMGNATAS